MGFSINGRSRASVAVLALVALAGCEAGGAGGAGSGPPAGFSCPAPGTRVTFNTGGTIVYRGADPADPAVCVVQTAANPAQRRLLNFFTLPLVDEPAVRRGLGALWPLEPGKSTNFSFVSETAGQRERFLYRETWRVVRSERAVIAGAQRDVLVITRTQEGQAGNTFLGTFTYRYDPASRVFLSASLEITRGSFGFSPFEATQVQLP